MKRLNCGLISVYTIPNVRSMGSGEMKERKKNPIQFIIVRRQIICLSSANFFFIDSNQSRHRNSTARAHARVRHSYHQLENYVHVVCLMACGWRAPCGLWWRKSKWTPNKRIMPILPFARNLERFWVLFQFSILLLLFHRCVSLCMAYEIMTYKLMAAHHCSYYASHGCPWFVLCSYHYIGLPQGPRCLA